MLPRLSPPGPRPALEPEPDPAGQQSPPSRAAGQPAAPAGEGQGAGTSRSQVTGRGAMVAMFGLFLAANLVSGWLGHEVVAGLAYLAACAAGPYLVRRHALLQVVVAPPAIFLIALVITQMATAQGTGQHGKALSVLEGTVLVLAALAPWLLAGTAICVGVAIPRGLVQCARDLKRELREDIEQRRPWAPRLR